MDPSSVENLLQPQEAVVQNGEVLMDNIDKNVNGWVLGHNSKVIETRPNNVEFVVQPKPDVSQYPMGVAYKKPGSKDLWRRVGDTEINITKLNAAPTTVSMPAGTHRLPAYTFNKSTNSGLFMPTSDAVGVSVCGLERLRVGRNATRLMNVLELTDLSTGLPTDATVGKLYKKPGSDGLWWATASGLVNLVDATKAPESVNGKEQKPGYSFDANDTSGMFLKEPGHVGMSVNGIERMAFKHSETVTNNPIRAAAGQKDLPSYSFGDSSKTGMYSPAADSVAFTNAGVESLRLSKGAIKVMNGSALQHADGEARAPSVSFTSEPSTGLHRSTPGALSVAVLGADVLTVSKSNINVIGSVTLAPGLKNMFGFAKHQSGMYSSDDGDLMLKAKAKNVLKLDNNGVTALLPLTSDVINVHTLDAQGSLDLNVAPIDTSCEFGMKSVVVSVKSNMVEFHKPVMVKDSSGDGGVLHKKTDSDGLWWTQGGSEYNLLTTGSGEVHYPLSAPAGTSYEFAEGNHRLTKKDDALVLEADSASLSLNPSGLTSNVPLVFKSQGMPVMSGTNGALYKKDGPELYWNVNGKEIDVTDTRYPLKAKGTDVKQPAYSFHGHSGCGMYYDTKVGFSFNSTKVFDYNGDRISFNQPLEMSDAIVDKVADGTGRLFKNAGSNALVWATSDGQYDLTESMSFPIKAPNGAESAPMYGFADDRYSGMYYSAGIVLTYKAKDRMTIDDNVHIYSDLHFHNDGSTGVLKLVGDKLAWVVDGKTSDFNTIEYPMKAPAGGVSQPAYSFGDTTSGLYHDATGVCVSANGAFVGKFDPKGLSVKGVLELSDLIDVPDDKLSGGRLYKKANDASLYWNVDGVTKNLTDTDTGAEYPLRAPQGLAYAFEDEPKTGLGLLQPGHLTLTVDDDAKILINKGMVTINSALAVNGSIALNDGVMVPSSLYRQGDKLFYADSTGKSCELTTSQFTGGALDQQLLVANGEQNAPSLAFAGDKDTGLRLLMPNMMSFACGGEDRVLFTEDGLRVRSKYAFVDGNSTIDNNDGRLNVSVAGKQVMSVAADSVNLVGKGASVLVSDKIEVSGQLLVDNAEVNASGGILTTKAGDTHRTYQSSETFTVNGTDLKLGDVVGIQNDGSGLITKVSGGKWSNDMKISAGDSGDSSRTSLWDKFDETHCIRLSTKERVVEDKSILSLSVTVFTNNTVVGSMSLELDSKFSGYKPEPRAVSLCKLKDNKYVVGFGDYGSIKKVTLRQFRVTLSGDVPNMVVESEVRHEMEEAVETFDLTYEASGSLDILIMTMYNFASCNLDVALFSAFPHLQAGHVQNSVSADPVIGNNKTLCTQLLPGHVVICSYGNNKCFLLLASSAGEAVSASDIIMDNDSLDCVDILYDSTNSVIMSVERTYTDTAYIQVSDMDGTKLNILRTKRLGRNTCVPLGLGHNPNTDNFVLFYADSVVGGQVHAQVFTHDGEAITFGLVYSRSNVDNLYTSPETKDGTNIPAFGKQVWCRPSGVLTAEWVSGSESSSVANFDDNFGVQATAYIGMAMHNAPAGSECEVSMKGQIFTGDPLPNTYVGKRVYLNNLINNSYPDNVTTSSHGNVFLGTCVTSNKILVGL